LLGAQGEALFGQGARIGDIDELDLFAALLFGEIAQRLQFVGADMRRIQRPILG
jgi:hypothetical protein